MISKRSAPSEGALGDVVGPDARHAPAGMRRQFNISGHLRNMPVVPQWWADYSKHNERFGIMATLAIHDQTTNGLI
jgi:hypothetical protein